MNPHHRLEQALRHHQAGAFGAAERLYRELLVEDPSAFAPLHMLGVLRAQQGDAEEGVALIGRALRIEPGAATAWLNQANILTGLGRRKEALASYDAALSLTDDVTIVHGRGRLLLEAGDPSQALPDFERVLASQPANFEAAKDRAVALSALGRNDEARCCYEALLSQRPDDLELLNNLGNVLRVARAFEEALRLYDRALAISPDIAEIWSNRAATLSELRRPHEAVESADRALALKPDLAEAWNNRGDALRELSDLEAALHSFGAALSRQPNYPAALNNRGKLLCEMHRVSEGFASFQQAARLVHGSASGLSHQSAFHQAQALYQAQHGVAKGERQEKSVLRTEHWAAGASAAWERAQPRLIVIDDLLTEEALDGLRRFCWGAPVWHRAYDAGYVGAFPETGFACPLLAQIAEEIRTSLPSVFAHHALRYLWGFSYDSSGAGTHVHADEAAVNVNFWITPDEANRAPSQGGLVVWDTAAPADWEFAQFNDDRRLVEDYLAREGATKVRIPYRANRAVIFDSNLFHQTDDFSFADGYCERRINITLLYGRRSFGPSVK